MPSFTSTAKVSAVGTAVKNPKTWLAAKSAKPAAKLAAKSAKPAAKLAAQSAKPAAKLTWSPAKALAKRRVRKRAGQVGQTARTVREVLLIQAPEAAEELGLIERRAPKRTAPRVAAGVVIGAGAMYLLEPGEHGRQHREKVSALVS
jgi:hypothetical protein